MNNFRIFLHVYCLISIVMSQFLSINAQYETYIVHMDLSLMPKPYSSHHTWYLNTFARVTISFSPSKFLYTYTEAINGFSARFSEAEHEAIKNTHGYISSSKESNITVDTTHSPEFLGLNFKSGAWPTANYGKDVIIGVIDTGVWPESESYKDHGMTEVPSRWKGACESGTDFNASLCNKKLIGARYFNKGLLAKYPMLKSILVNSTRDDDGHGTHTSSTAAGNYVHGASFFGYAAGNAQGAAPLARVAIYKALWNPKNDSIDGWHSSDIIAAMDQAIKDGVDILSMSLGEENLQLYEDPIAIAALSAVEKGIFVSTSAGNAGPSFGTLHNGIPWVLTVAAGTIDREFKGRLNLGSKVSFVGASVFPGNYSSSLVFMNECSDVEELKKHHKKNIVVCQSNSYFSLDLQVEKLQRAHVSGGVFITNTSYADFLNTQFPTIFLNYQDGDRVLSYINSTEKPTGSIEFKSTQLGTKPAPQVWSYSSRGPSLICPWVMKPDVMAPGHSVLASWPPNSAVGFGPSGNVLYSYFNIESGTSMACPHASGIAALVKAIHPEWSPAAIRSAMMTTADVLDNTLNPIGDMGDKYKAASPLAMGSGNINPNKAVDPGLVYDTSKQDYVNFICSLNYTPAQIKTITRSSTYDCSTPSVDLNYPSFIAYFDGNNKTVHEFERTLTNVGDGMSIYNVKLSVMDGLKVSVVPEKLVFTKIYEKKSFKVFIEGYGDLLVWGYLSWVENNGNHAVTSPILVASWNITSSLG